MNPNPYLPPESATRVKRKPFALFKTLAYVALACGSLCAVLVALATHSALLGAATVFASLMLCLLNAAVLAWFSERADAEDVPLDHRKEAMPEPRKMQGDRYTPQQRCNAGHTLPQALTAMGLLLGVLLFIPVVVFIITTVMGMQEPKW